MIQRSRSLPIWIWGALLGLVLIVLSTRGRLSPENPALRDAFAAQPAPVLPELSLPNFELGNLPTEFQQAARDLLAQLGAGQAGRPVQTAVETPRLRVEVRELRPVQGGMMLVGEVTNLSQSDVLVPLSAFELRDSAGVSYIAGGGASATLRPGASTPLELTVPLPEGRGLIMTINLPPDPPIEQRLILIE
ncbi:MAG: hypothetical protein AB4911_21765 [Oscillochloridaceae bacterium umkhey_bin13]